MSTVTPVARRTNWVCPQAWRNFFVDFYGDVYVCCLNDTKIGSLKEGDFGEIWRSHRLQHLRSLHLGGDYVNSSCQQTCHELIKHIPENVDLIGTGFPGYNPDARTGDERLDGLPASPHPAPSSYEDNAQLLDVELDERFCGTQSFPTRGLIVPVQRCNLRCPMCDTGVMGSKMPNGYISEEVFDRLIPVYPYLDYLEVVGGGEIFLHSPAKSPITKLLRDLKAHTGPNFELLLQTNGTTLTKPWVDLLLDLDIASIINVSIDTVDPETYDVVRAGSSFDRLRKNLDYLEERKAKLGLDKPNFRFSVVLSDYTAFGLLDMQEFIRGYSTAFLYLQVLQKGGHEWFVDEHNLFRPDRRDDLLRFREILDGIDVPSNKDTVYDLINTCLGDAPAKPAPKLLGPIEVALHEDGHCWTAPLPQAEGQLILTEDGLPLGPGDAVHADIRARGRGRFSVWGDAIYFSASDNSDPTDNGRRYELLVAT
jgi:MoaA/NifB/PqqE/SkfB family radical SAM enzyme